jgi:hypothetical protein
MLQKVGWADDAQRPALEKVGNGFLYSLLDHAWIQVVAIFFPRGVLPAVSLGKDPLPAHSQILLMDQTNVLDFPSVFASRLLAQPRSAPPATVSSPRPDHPFQDKITLQQLPVQEEPCRQCLVLG